MHAKQQWRRRWTLQLNKINSGPVPVSSPFPPCLTRKSCRSTITTCIHSLHTCAHSCGWKTVTNNKSTAGRTKTLLTQQLIARRDNSPHALCYWCHEDFWKMPMWMVYYMKMTWQKETKQETQKSNKWHKIQTLIKIQPQIYILLFLEQEGHHFQSPVLHLSEHTWKG